ncbi:MAG: hypothetical protein WA634_18455 [Silvibacterium sp.]
MKTSIQARLDSETQVILERLTKRLGWSPSRIVREGLRLLAQDHRLPSGTKIIGLGKFNAGPSDLATNKKHMEGFGR